MKTEKDKYFKQRMFEEEKFWKCPKTIILNILTFGMYGFKHCGLI